MHIDIVEHLCVRLGGIGKIDIFIIYLAVFNLENGVRGVRDIGLFVEYFSYTLSGRARDYHHGKDH